MAPQLLSTYLSVRKKYPMKIQRRQFIRDTSLATIAFSFSRALYGQSSKKMLVGMQLYCVRDAMRKDPLGTLKQLAAMGYKHVEHANYVSGKFYGYTPKEFKTILNDLGMTMPSGHTVLRPDHWDAAAKDFTAVWKQTVEDAAYMEQQYVISPSIDMNVRTSYDALMRQLDYFNRSGELCKKHGMLFGYHNHDFEFSESHNGKSLYDIILDETDADLVMQQLDTGNLFNGGAIASAVIARYPARFKSIHVKDAVLRPGDTKHYESTVLGKGVAEIKNILAAIEKQGTNPHLIIEQEAYQGRDPLECMKQNLAIMKKWGYA